VFDSSKLRAERMLKETGVICNRRRTRRVHLLDAAQRASDYQRLKHVDAPLFVLADPIRELL
jgi:hypothetical protein